MEISDIHTHVLPMVPGSALVNIGCGPLPQVHGHYFSAGLHPWEVTGSDEESFRIIDSLLSRSDVIAVGECGFDALRGTSVEKQERAFIRQFELSESHSIPMILHIVREFDRVIRFKKMLKPSQKWLIHGFRGGPEQAGQLLGCGFCLSFGLTAREDTIRAVPEKNIMAETDGKCGIGVVIGKISMSLGMEYCETEALIRSNNSDFFA